MRIYVKHIYDLSIATMELGYFRGGKMAAMKATTAPGRPYGDNILPVIMQGEAAPLSSAPALLHLPSDADQMRCFRKLLILWDICNFAGHFDLPTEDQRID